MDPELRTLLDRQQILDCIHRYTRGVDRLDVELTLSAYHEDAIDSHGPFSGSPREFVDWLWPRQATRWASQHFVTNHTVELDGDTAHAETYYLFAARTCHDELTAQGIDLTAYGSADRAEDVDDLAVALGLSHINLVASGTSTNVVREIAGLVRQVCAERSDRCLLIDVDQPRRAIPAPD